MALVDLNVLAWILLALVALIVAIQSASVAMFVRLLFGFSRSKVSDDALPPAAVVLSIRGPDPFLGETVRALLRQEYPDFWIAIVLDNEHDPARKIIESVIRQTGADNVRISVLRRRRDTCSLKCSSLIQALEDLDPTYQVVAFVDGDAKPYPHWLQDLAAPLADPEVGVVTGNRWYRPEIANWGSLVRYFWNAGAVVQGWLNGLVWAGSMAMRRECIERVELLDAWSQALSVDATVYCQLRKHGLRVRFAPSVMMVNSEHISLPAFRGWVRRQLVTAKICSDGWTVVMLHWLYLAFTQVLGVGLLVLTAVYGNGPAVLTTAAVLALYWSASVASVAALELGVRRIARLNEQPGRWLRPMTLLRLLPALVLTHVVYTADLIAACFCRRVSWRGVDYTILGKNTVRMVSYHPFHEVSGSQSRSSVV